jgi:NAD(P)-dependent dehydrogenase (short-subunit alcohol dehydrogenase family)
MAKRGMATALVTGANRGIGLALCRRFVKRGDAVVAVCRTTSPDLDALAASSGGRVRIEAGVDVTQDAPVAALADHLAGTSLDVLVLSAGILRADDLDSAGNAGWEDLRAQIEVNAIAPVRVARALRPLLHDGSKIAVITSRMGSIADNGSGGYYGYRMSKAALNAAAVSLARDLRLAGVAVAILHPGFVRTEMTGGNGNITADESARLLTERIDGLSLATTGTFWHASGEVLPW